MNKFYVLIRDNILGDTDYITVEIPEGKCPTYGYDGWEFFCGPFNSFEDAEHLYPDESSVLANTWSNDE
jgi:hypothetical protein